MAAPDLAHLAPRKRDGSVTNIRIALAFGRARPDQGEVIKSADLILSGPRAGARLLS